MARVDGPFGVHGEVRLASYAEDPLALLHYRTLSREDGSTGLTLETGRQVKGALIVRAVEVETREQAQALRGLGLYVDRNALPEPEEDEYYLADLIGLAAVTPAGEGLGRIRSVQNFGAGDLLEIQPDHGGPSWWSPFTREAAPEVSLARGEVVVARLPETSADT